MLDGDPSDASAKVGSEQEQRQHLNPVHVIILP